MFAAVPLNPRALMAQVVPSTRATASPVARRSTSASVVAPERRIWSPVITSTAAGASEMGSLLRDTDVTSISIRSSRASRLRGVASWAPAAAGTHDGRDDEGGEEGATDPRETVTGRGNAIGDHARERTRESGIR